MCATAKDMRVLVDLAIPAQVDQRMTVPAAPLTVALAARVIQAPVAPGTVVPVADLTKAPGDPFIVDLADLVMTVRADPRILGLAAIAMQDLVVHATPVLAAQVNIALPSVARLNQDSLYKF